MSSYKKAYKWRRMSVFDGVALEEHWCAKIRDMVDEPILKRTPCNKCNACDYDVCPNYWVVKSLFELTRLVGALQYNNPKCLLWFRGERNRHLNATPKACRDDKEWDDFLEMTKWFNCNAGKGRLFSNRGELARWAIFQHYGAPTPLLDVTTSLRIAIFNALGEFKDNNNGKKNKKDVSPNILVFATPRPLDSTNIFTEAGLCLIDLVAELPSNCLRLHVQRAGFLGLTDIVMDGLEYCKKRPLKEEANLNCVRIAKICIKKLKVDFDMPKSNHVFPPASKYTIIGCKEEGIIRDKTDDMSGDYLLRALYELNKLSESSGPHEPSKPCPLKKGFPNHYWEDQ